VTMGVKRLFIDTNVLVYASVTSTPLHHTALSAIVNYNNAGTELWISRQVLREYVATVTRPQTYAAPIPTIMAAADVQQFQAQFDIAEDGPQVTANLLHLLQTVSVAGKQVHDANIVATMQAYNIQQLLTHNVRDFARFSHLITVLTL
jgi:predicted nucleic acid-binding protein